MQCAYACLMAWLPGYIYMYAPKTPAIMAVCMGCIPSAYLFGCCNYIANAWVCACVFPECWYCATMCVSLTLCLLLYMCVWIVIPPPHQPIRVFMCCDGCAITCVWVLQSPCMHGPQSACVRMSRSTCVSGFCMRNACIPDHRDVTITVCVQWCILMPV